MEVTFDPDSQCKGWEGHDEAEAGEGDSQEGKPRHATDFPEQAERPPRQKVKLAKRCMLRSITRRVKAADIGLHPLS